MGVTIRELAWPLSHLGEALETLGRAAGLAPRAGAAVGAPPEESIGRLDDLARWIDAAATALDLDAEPLEIAYGEIEPFLRGGGPALVPLAGEEAPYFLALVRGGRRTVVLLGRDWRQHRVSLAQVAAWLRRYREGTVAEPLDALLDEAGIEGAPRARARGALLHDRLRAVPLAVGWVLRLPAHAPFRRHLRQARLPRYFTLYCVAQVLHALGWIASWWIVGRAAFEGRFDPGALLAWTFLLASLVPLTVLAAWTQGVFTLGTAGLLKQRLLAGALRLDPDRTRHQGAGQHLARVFESEAIEAQALGGGFSTLMGGLDVALAAAIFIVAGQTVHAVGLLAVLLLVALTARRQLTRRRRWAEARLAMTHDLVERMVGHRTRLAQGGNARRDGTREEDEALEGYLGRAREMDRATLLEGVTPRIWLLVAIAGLGPAFVGSRLSAELLAVILGATLLAGGGLLKLVGGLMALATVRVAWTQIAPLLEAATRAEPAGAMEGTRVVRDAPGAELLSAHDVSYRFPGRAEPVLRHVQLRVVHGDRLLLSGASGAGKSTLVSLMTGLRTPDSGLLLLDGLDRPTLGSARWRQRVAAAVQFHENHVFTESLAFNLLMGRRWPPRGNDLAEAEAICRRLGLGALIDRMPGGLFQLVGETGWQLSHGERSRLFVARALLQGAALVVLDESFAELDPESLRDCLRQVSELSPTLLVVAHA